MDIPRSLVELWLTVVHGALCRQVAGGLLVQLPEDTPVLVASHDEAVRKLGVLFASTDRDQLEQEANRTFSSDWLFVIVADDLKKQAPQETPHLSLRRALSELQSYLLDTADQVPEEATLLRFFLKQGEYRSRHVAVKRAVYRVVPHEGGWKVQRQGHTEGETYALKDEAIRAGADRAQTHVTGQLIIHASNGTFQEERTYGNDPSESQG